ncbi:hypothetical protein [Streptomyces sp. 6-11-2]|uniref:hypothetical protein n=1 Tax=Streptomyces sp. 6-11-2 TaxID=2585753 RepID=UPI001142AD1F|nr:hypothetical protein [Streptomyces sp. 6-11-2]GED89859.1 hypothetical protein TNCT6_69440 [Streptomyces sp. 6-11-2]
MINQQLRRGARGSGTAAILATRNTTLCRAHAARPARAALAGVPGFASVDGLASVVAAAALHRMAIYGRRAHTSPRPLGLRIGPAQTTTPGFTVRKGTSRPPEYEALSTTKAQATTNI